MAVLIFFLSCPFYRAVLWKLFQNFTNKSCTKYRGADKSLARPGRKKLQRQKIFIFIYPIYYHNWRNISTIYI